MSSVYLIKSNFKYELKKTINQIIIKNKLYYRNLYINLIEEIELSSDFRYSDKNKNIFILKDIFENFINEKKYITYLYDVIYKHINTYYKDKFNIIVSGFYSILNEITYKIDNIDFNMEIDKYKFFNSFDIKFKVDEYDSLVLKLINFLDVISSVDNKKLFITYDLYNILTKEEYNNLIDMVKYKDYNLIDISSVSSEELINDYLIVIDEDYVVY